MAKCLALLRQDDVLMVTETRSVGVVVLAVEADLFKRGVAVVLSMGSELPGP